jgi:hypothetical protein
MWPSFWNHRFTQSLGHSARAGRQARPGRSPGRRRCGTLRPCLEVLEDRTVLSSTVYWTGLGNPNHNDPNWSNPGNWSSGQVPEAGDTVVFTKSYSQEDTSTVDAGFTAANVTLFIDNTWWGYLNLAHSLTLTGDSAFYGEPGSPLEINLAGNTLTNDGSLTLNPAAGALYQAFIANDLFEGGNHSNLGGTLANRGTIVQQGGGDLALEDSVRFDNQAGATYDFASDGSIDTGTSGQAMRSAGTVEKTGGTGTSTIEVACSNLNGTLAADSGTLELACPYPGGVSTGGTFDAAQGAVLNLTGTDGGLNVFTGSYTGSGQGAVLIKGAVDPFVVGPGGATFDFPAGLLQWDGVINLQGNTLTNTGFLTLTNAAANQDLFISNDYSQGGNQDNLGGALVNKGTIVQQGGGDLTLDDSVQIDNQAGATYDFASDGSLRIGGGSAAVANAGTVEKTSGTGTSTIGLVFSNTGVPFSNTGVLDVESGTLQFPGGLPLDGSAVLTGTVAGTLSVQGNVLGHTTNAAQFAPLDTVVLAGPGASSPQLLEVMSQDRGNVASGFVNNFSYGTLEVAAGIEVRLVDKARNSPGTGPEALYVDTLVVPAGATLDLNGLHVYVRSAQVQGTVVGGSISVLAAPVPAAAVQGISATAGQPFSGAVATITDTFSGVTAGSLQATITWGDGQTSAGTVSANGDGTFGVSGTHTYAQPGSYALSVAVQDTANNKSATAQGTATVHAVVPPPTPIFPLFVVLRRVRSGKAAKLLAEVIYTDGLPHVDIMAPYQPPGYQGIAAALQDRDGDGILDALVFTARRGRRHVSTVMPVGPIVIDPV